LQSYNAQPKSGKAGAIIVIAILIPVLFLVILIAFNGTSQKDDGTGSYANSIPVGNINDVEFTNSSWDISNIGLGSVTIRIYGTVRNTGKYACPVTVTMTIYDSNKSIMGTYKVSLGSVGGGSSKDFSQTATGSWANPPSSYSLRLS
jgi:hypothetical protein